MHNLTLSVFGEGTVEIYGYGNLNEWIPDGELVTIIARPATNHHFINWTLPNGDIFSTDAHYTFYLHESVAVMANFGYSNIADRTLLAPLQARTNNGLLHIDGLIIGKPFSVYSVSGALVHQNVAVSEKAEIALSVRGFYIVQQEIRVIKIAFFY